MFQPPKKHSFEYTKVLRDRRGEPVLTRQGTVIRRTIRTDSAAKIAAFDATNCFTK